MAKIQIMKESLANKIAAGEVVERPASVVKELIENAIDANATKIDIHLTESGLKQIKVIDNGDGMDKEDCMLAFSRHATSKLLDERDLFRIHTLGFRGEALPSIASVSDVHITTSNGNEAGTYINIKGGNIIAKKQSHARKGTEIQVNSLFYNTPARLKHLKTIHTELSYITDFANKMAMSHPYIAFRLYNDQRLLLQTNGNNNLLNVLAAIYGINVVKKIHKLEYSDEVLSLKLYISEPDMNRASRNYVTSIINNRVIKNYAIVKAVNEGYHTYLPQHRYPIVVLDMKIDPLLVDVNVHPAKLDVRLSNEAHIKSVITDLINKKLKELMYIPKITIPNKKALEEDKGYVQDKLFQQSVTHQRDIGNQDSDTQDSISELNAFDQKNANSYRELEDSTKNFKDSISEQSNHNDYSESTYTETEADSTPKETVTNKKRLPNLDYIGQLGGTYLIAQNEEGLFLIDQHAAQERINYEFYLSQLSKTINEFYDLLVPITLEFTMNESLIIEERADVLREIGIKFEKFGIKSFIVTRLPNWFGKADEKYLLDTIFDHILREKKLTYKQLFEELAITLSCKRSIKANHYINEYEVKKLLHDLETCDNPYTCPHGRPVVINMSYSDIEKLFKRIQ
ncbi:DNA mismatch repair endonuclease MutL [Haloplasma contractile]|uniref:DNA mismatch repair protein MutL n=1 Tax=Haloplasma contractile SSD-17B TaxID=1033810 RepID=U2FLN7_9MOLU|nr:DNA mismatch repair endonuclease MutL [Haloplasma contractile]ERJ13665.1 DNA mismatch repair protein MutL [Haloplasma contractile SSD-17B]